LPTIEPLGKADVQRFREPLERRAAGNGGQASSFPIEPGLSWRTPNTVPVLA
jgi:hypothetical protein